MEYVIEARNYIRDKYLEYGKRGNAEKEIDVYFMNALDQESVAGMFKDLAFSL